jgi:hypothetical protein
MTREQSLDRCLEQHLDWRDAHPDRPVDEEQFAHQLGQTTEEFAARLDRLKKSRLSITPPNSDLDGIGEGK